MHEVVRIDGGILDADEDLVCAGSVGLRNVDAFKTVDGVAKSCELNSTHWVLPLNQGKAPCSIEFCLLASLRVNNS
jgi:hypothetical protein